DAVFSPLEQELPVGTESLDAPIHLIRNVYCAVGRDRDPARLVEFAVALPVLAPLANEAAVGRVHAGLVAPPGRAIDASLPVHGDPTGHGIDCEAAEQLSFGREPLDAFVPELADENLVFDVDRQADRCI